MNNYKTLKFGGNVYPYADIDVYDYNLNRNRIVTVSTTELNTQLTHAVFSNDDKLKKRGAEIDGMIEFFIPSDILLTKTEEEIGKYVSENLFD